MNAVYFNRYLAIRYWMALYFFIDMYWLILLCLEKSILSLFLSMVFIYFGFAIVEQVKKYHTRNNNLRFTKNYFNVQIISNFVKAVLLILSFKFEVFPYISLFGAQLLCGVSLLEIIGCILLKKRIEKIENNQDKYYIQIQEYLKKRGENYGSTK